MASQPHVLVAYATAHGSTGEIADRIAARLAERGLRVDCTPVGDAPDVRTYDALVIGSAIHSRAWLPEAIAFVKEHGRQLAGKPVWLFSVGMPAALAPWLAKWAAGEGPKVIEPLRGRLRSRGEHLFSGVVRSDQISAFGRLVFRLMGGHFGDFRDNREIDGWATNIADGLLAEATTDPTMRPATPRALPE